MANSRIYVHEKIYDEFAKRFSASFAQFKHGDPLSKETTMGPQADEIQAKAVQSYLDIGNKEGKAILGGGKSDAGDKYVAARSSLVLADLVCSFFKPTIFTDISESSRINKEEVFGGSIAVQRLIGSDRG